MPLSGLVEQACRENIESRRRISSRRAARTPVDARTRLLYFHFVAAYVGTASPDLPGTTSDILAFHPELAALVLNHEVRLIISIILVKTAYHALFFQLGQKSSQEQRGQLA